MYPVNTREDWPFGPALRKRRVDAGLSVKAAARRTNKRISDGRWYQLESGYQQVGGQRLPISTKAATVAAAALAVGWDVSEALELAGFDPIDLPVEERSPLQEASDDELLGEVRRRMRSGDQTEEAAAALRTGVGRAADELKIKDRDQHRKQMG